MRRKNSMLVRLIVFIGLTEMVLADGKPPEIWCKAASEYKEYLEYGLTQEEACGKAVEMCSKQTSGRCHITEWGEW